MQRRDLSGRARADKLDPSIIGEDLLHRRGGEQRAAILACERYSFPGATRPAFYLQPWFSQGQKTRTIHHALSTKTVNADDSNLLMRPRERQRLQKNSAFAT